MLSHVSLVAHFKLDIAALDPASIYFSTNFFDTEKGSLRNYLFCTCLPTVSHKIVRVGLVEGERWG